ncbi:hypothetical protein B0H11DRAFT_2227553 [Mycena galericulata]|nr:hypothetical protein B0H11DRAFT_2227553 [Mycena galericulata]
MDGFWLALTRGEGGLTGSAPVWVTKADPTWTPADLNAVAVNGEAHHVRGFLRHIGWAEEITATRIPIVMPARSLTHSILAHPASSLLASTTWKYSKPGCPSITLTETAAQTVFLHLAGAKHTLATMLMTASSLIALHPYECIKRYTTFRHGSGLPADERRHASDRAAIMGGRENYFQDLSGPCGGRCPALLRRMRGGEAIGLLRWNDGPIDGVTKEAYEGFMENRYAFGWTWAACRNSECSTFSFPRDILSTLPKSVVLSQNPKENRIQRTIHAVNHCSPPFPKIYTGILFATACDEPYAVPVPLDHGRTTYYTMDDLRGYTWITPRVMNYPVYPAFVAPYETVGSTSIFHAIGWKEYIENDTALLIFMTSVHPLGPVNLALAPESLKPRAVHGDVLLMLEVGGQVQDVGIEDIDLLRTAFASIWSTKKQGDGLGTVLLSSF